MPKIVGRILQNLGNILISFQNSWPKNGGYDWQDMSSVVMVLALAECIIMCKNKI